MTTAPNLRPVSRPVPGGGRPAVTSAVLLTAFVTVGCDVRDEEVRPTATPRLWNAAATSLRDEAGSEPGAARGIEYVEGYAGGRRRAAAEGLPMLVVFRATWCRWSSELANGPLADRDVVTAARRFVCVTVDADRDAATCHDFGVSGFPTVIVIDPAGQERFRATGAAAAARLPAIMNEVLEVPGRYADGPDDTRL